MRLAKKLMVVFCLLFLSVFFVESVLPENYSVITAAEAAGKVKLSQKKATINVGDKLELTVEGTTKKVKWSSSDPSVASVKKGKVTGKKAGKAEITAKVGKKKYTCKVTVKSVIKVDNTKVTLEENQSTKVKVTYTADGKIECKVSNANVVSCEWEGGWKGNKRNLKIKAKEPGTATITVKDKKRKDSVTINVVVKADTKWTAARLKIMLNKMKVAMDSCSTATDYASKALKNSLYLNLAISKFSSAASDIKNCIDYASAYDPITSTSVSTVVSLLEEAYAVYTSFDQNSATRFNIVYPVAEMSSKQLSAEELLLNYAKAFIQ